jgi:glyoxylase-like metal-dependent hydrolase (beta-lactamase superfamily II)/Tfp pilus assembly protein PilF
MTGFLRLGAALAMSAFLGAPLIAAEDKAVKEAWDKLPAAERWFQQGLKEFQAGRRAAAAADFEKCLGQIPRHAFARYYLANIDYIENDMPRALEAMDRAIGDLGFMESLNDYALTQKNKTYDSYKRMMAEEWDSTGSCRTHRELETLYGQITDAEKKQELEIEAQKTARARQKAHYLYFRGNINFQLKRLADAARDYEQALALNPRHANAYNNLSAIHYLAGDHGRALALLEEAERQGLEDNLNLKLRFLVFEALGRPTAGILEEEIDAGAASDLGVVRFALATKSTDPLRPPLYENGYLVFSRATREAVLIDPGAEDPRIDEAVRARGLKVRAILNTHNHEDHVGADAVYAGLYRVPILIKAADAGGLGMTVAKTFADGETLSYSGLSIKVIHIPGHTPGSVGFLAGEFLFSGDTLFKDGIGLVTSWDADTARKLQAAMVRGIKDKLLVLPDSTIVCPGHGRTTTIAGERASNPFLMR